MELREIAEQIAQLEQIIQNPNSSKGKVTSAKSKMMELFNTVSESLSLEDIFELDDLIQNALKE